MRKLGFLMLIAFCGCTTLGKWTDSSMAWADRTMPTYDDWFGDEKPAQPQYTQQNPAPVVPVQAVNTIPAIQPMSAEQEMYYDNSERGYSFGKAN